MPARRAGEGAGLTREQDPPPTAGQGPQPSHGRLSLPSTGGQAPAGATYRAPQVVCAARRTSVPVFLTPPAALGSLLTAAGRKLGCRVGCGLRPGPLSGGDGSGARGQVSSACLSPCPQPCHRSQWDSSEGTGTGFSVPAAGVSLFILRAQFPPSLAQGCVWLCSQ